jgi:hypothetical protein
MMDLIIGGTLVSNSDNMKIVLSILLT